MKKRLFLSFLASTLLFAACDISFSFPDYIPGNQGVPNNTERTFWAQDVRNDSFYTLKAVQLAIGEYCTVWGETGNNRATPDVARTMAAAYDTDVYPKMKAVFGIENIEYEGYNYRDTMVLADYFGDEDGKLCILLLDIRDGFNSNTGGGFVAGYFAWIDFLSNSNPDLIRYNLKSNERDMIYVDTYPSTPGSAVSNETLAHELQHLMNFVHDNVLRNTLTDTWLTEGLSAAAEWVYNGYYDTDRINRFNSPPAASKISTGNNFFAWNQYDDMNTNLDDYATVYLFFQWLRLQSGGSTNVYRSISRSSHSDYNAIVGAMNGYDEWAALLKTWLAANYINASAGPYGYMNDDTLKTIRAKTAPSGTRNVNLYPGEGVYSVTNTGFNMPSNSGNIRYAGLNRSSGDVSDTAVFASGALLTYNVDTNSGGRAQAGTTTGVAASVEEVPESLSVRTALSGPYKVSMSDMLRHNGYEVHSPAFLRLHPGDNDN